ncbi:histidine--tRNA ligase [Candidatus Kaiserbacteria bacterium]|nr:histidine--tRNA ligase [Candidatus Kaiserbacteria bacterium]
MSPVPMRGMRDLLPKEVELRHSVINTIRAVYQSYGFTEIETPVVERAELLNTGEGGDNEKQIFGVLRRGLDIEEVKNIESLQDLVDGGLRFDLTVPLARYYANNQANLPSPFKALQIGNVFRAERPQKGRYRQFTQCDIDVIGETSSLVERELALATSEALLKIGFSDFTIRLNDRRILKGIVEACGFTPSEFDLVFIIIDKLDKIALDGVAAELDERTTNDEAVTKLVDFLRRAASADVDPFAELPAMIDTAAITDLQSIINDLNEQADGNFVVRFDPTLVRGMGYYTGPIFEIEDKDFPSSIAAGGRYDRMIGKYTGTPVPACGFSIGFERVIALLEERGATVSEAKEKKVIIYTPEIVSVRTVLKLAKEARATGETVLVQSRKKNTKKQLDDLTSLGYTAFCLLEASDSPLQFKDLTK